MKDNPPTLSAEAVRRQLHENGVTHIVWLPDTESNFMYGRIAADPALHIVAVAREGECIPIAAGLWMGGQKPVVMVQNTGLLESGDSVRGMGVDIELPLVMLVGYRGWTRRGPIRDSAARLTEPTLDAWGVGHYLIETDRDVGRISEAFAEAERTRRPVACLIGAEYSS